MSIAKQHYEQNVRMMHRAVWFVVVGFSSLRARTQYFFFPSVPLYFSMVSMHSFIDMSQLVRNDSINLIGWPVRFAHIHNIKLILKKF